MGGFAIGSMGLAGHGAAVKYGLAASAGSPVGLAHGVGCKVGVGKSPRIKPGKEFGATVFISEVCSLTSAVGSAFGLAEKMHLVIEPQNSRQI